MVSRLLALLPLLCACYGDKTFVSSGGGGHASAGGGGAGASASDGGNEEGGRDTGGTDTGGTHVGGSGSCNQGEQCVPSAPVGFNGPALVVSGHETSCDNGVAMSGGVISDMQPSCECDYVGSAPCLAPTVHYYKSASSCGTLVGVIASPVDMCTALTVSDPPHTVDGDAPLVINPGSCGAGAPPEASYEQPIEICNTLAVGAACDAGSCAPMSPGASVCVWSSDTNTDCNSAGPYTQASSFSTAMLSCPACSAPAVNCAGNTQLYANATCSGSFVSVQQSSGTFCQDADILFSAPTHALFHPADATAFAGKCTDTAATVNQTPITVCCLP